MNDKELADKVESLGIARPQEWTNPTGEAYSGRMRFLSHEKFVRDPRVAMALMEKMVKCQLEWWVGAVDGLMHVCFGSVRDDKDYRSSGESLPRAIVEACAEALYVEPLFGDPGFPKVNK